MNSLFDITNIIFLVLAIVIFLRLRSVLGRKTGNERPPFEGMRGDQTEAAARGADNVVRLPRASEIESPPDARLTDEEQAERVEKVAPAGSKLNAALTAIVSADNSFRPEEFVQGARAAYEMIVVAFAEGDRKTLKSLLSKEVYDGFVAAIDERERAEHRMETTFVGIDKADIVEASLKGSTAQIGLRFVSQLISVTRDSEDRVVDGDPNRVTEVVDVWTFARDIRSRDPNWALVATEAAD